jgi:hypothetical protein
MGQSHSVRFRLRTLILVVVLISIPLIVASGFLHFIRAFGEGWHKAIDPVTDSGGYTELLQRARDQVPELVDHFPDSIPEQAKNVRFYYRPHFLQGPLVLQLRVTLPAAEVATIESQYAPLATHSFQGGDDNIHMNLPNGTATTFDFTSSPQAASFPASFTLYVLESEARGDGVNRWNHGSTCGLAIDKSQSEVVYWCESW